MNCLRITDGTYRDLLIATGIVAQRELDVNELPDTSVVSLSWVEATKTLTYLPLSNDTVEEEETDERYGTTITEATLEEAIAVRNNVNINGTTTAERVNQVLDNQILFMNDLYFESDEEFDKFIEATGGRLKMAADGTSPMDFKDQCADQEGELTIAIQQNGHIAMGRTTMMDRLMLMMVGESKFAEVE